MAPFDTWRALIFDIGLTVLFQLNNSRWRAISYFFVQCQVFKISSGFQFELPTLIGPTWSFKVGESTTSQAKAYRRTFDGDILL